MLAVGDKGNTGKLNCTGKPLPSGMRDSKKRFIDLKCLEDSDCRAHGGGQGGGAITQKSSSRA